MELEMEKEYGSKIINNNSQIHMKGILLIRKSKDMESLYGKIVVNILVILLMIKDMAMGKCIGMMEIFIKDNGKMGNN